MSIFAESSRFNEIIEQGLQVGWLFNIMPGAGDESTRRLRALVHIGHAAGYRAINIVWGAHIVNLGDERFEDEVIGSPQSPNGRWELLYSPGERRGGDMSDIRTLYRETSAAVYDGDVDYADLGLDEAALDTLRGLILVAPPETPAGTLWVPPQHRVTSS